MSMIEHMITHAAYEIVAGNILAILMEERALDYDHYFSYHNKMPKHYCEGIGDLIVNQVEIKCAVDYRSDETDRFTIKVPVDFFDVFNEVEVRAYAKRMFEDRKAESERKRLQHSKKNAADERAQLLELMAKHPDLVAPMQQAA